MDILKQKFSTLSDRFRKGTLPLTRRNYCYLALILVNQIAYGISDEILYPIEAHLATIYGTDADHIDLFFLPIYGAFLIGSLFYLYSRPQRYLNRQVTLAVACLLISVTVSLLPHYGHLWIAQTAMALNGVASGVWQASSTIWLIELLLPDRVMLLIGLQANQLAFNLGSSVVAHWITAPFVPTTTGINNNNGYSNQTDSPISTERALAIPFLLYGYAQAVVPVLFLLLYCMNPYRTVTQEQARRERKRIFTLVEDTPEMMALAHFQPNRNRKLTLAAAALVTYYTAEIGYLHFSSQLLASGLNLSEQKVTQASIDLTISGLIGPLVSAALSTRVRPQVVIVYHYSLITGALALLFLGYRYQLLVLAANALLGLGLSPLLPAMLVFAELTFHLSPRELSLYTFVCGVVNLLTPLFKRVIFQNFESPMVLLALIGALIPVSLVLFLVLHWWCFHKDKRTDKDHKHEEEDD